jgi:hypothetical protein
LERCMEGQTATRSIPARYIFSLPLSREAYTKFCEFNILI